jgi:hypothetical protein
MDSSLREEGTFESYWDDLDVRVYKPMGCICHLWESQFLDSILFGMKSI